MANTSARNVLRVDTTATFTGSQFIRGLKYIGNASGTAIITDAAGGLKLWEEAGATNVSNPELYIRATNGITVTLTNGAIVYIYLE